MCGCTGAKRAPNGPHQINLLVMACMRHLARSKTLGRKSIAAYVFSLLWRGITLDEATENIKSLGEPRFSGSQSGLAISIQIELLVELVDWRFVSSDFLRLARRGHCQSVAECSNRVSAPPEIRHG